MKINMINSIKHRITSVSILSRFCLASLIWIIVGGFSTNVWGYTAKVDWTNSANKNQRSWGGDHNVVFTISGENMEWTSSWLNNRLKIDADKDYTISWSIDPGYTISVTAIKGKMGNSSVGGKKAYINGVEWGDLPTTGTNENLNMSLSLGNTDSITLRATGGPGIYWLEIEYTITNQYTITLNNQSATSAGTTSITATYDSNSNLTSAITPPTKTGYDFGGYYTLTNGAGDQFIDADGYVQASVSPYTDANKKWINVGGLEVYAKWTAKSYTITLNDNGGSGGDGSHGVTFDAATGNLSNKPTRTGYSFGGYSTSSGTKVFNSDKTPKASVDGYTDGDKKWIYPDNVTLYADWIGNSYTVIFDANGGTGSMSDQDFTYGTAQNLTKNVFERDNHTVTFDPNGGTCGTASATTSYSFAGWNTQSDTLGINYADQEEVNNLTTEDDGEVTLYAKWRGGIILPDATKSGWVLGAWLNGEDSVGVAGSTYSPTEDDIKLKAKWIEKYTPVFNFPDYDAVNNYYLLLVGGTYNGFTFSHVSDTVAVISDTNVMTYSKATKNLTGVTAGDATIQFTEAGTTKINPGVSTTWNVKVREENTLALNDLELELFYYVGSVIEDILDDESINNTDVDIQTTSSAPGIAHYDVEEDKIVIDNTGDSIFDTKIVTIAIYQGMDETYAASDSLKLTLTIKKYANKLQVNSLDVYEATMEIDEVLDDIVFTAANTDYANSPFIITQTSGATNILTPTYNSSTQTLSLASNYRGGATGWTVTQAESRSYLSAEISFTVEVEREDEETCYVLTNQKDEQHNSLGGTTHEHTWTDANSAGVVNFEVAHGSGSVSYYVEVQEYKNGSWTTVPDSKFDDMGVEPYIPKSVPLSETATGVRFFCSGTMTGIWVRNVNVTRKTRLITDVDTLKITKTAGNNPIYPHVSDAVQPGAGQFEIRYSVSNGGDLKIVSDNPKFTFSQTTIEDPACSADTVSIDVTYASATAGNDTANVVIYNAVYCDTIVLVGTTVKHNQVGSWQRNINTLKRGTKIADAFTSTLSEDKTVEYSILSGTAITIKEDTLIANATGTSRIQANVDGNDLYNAIESTIDITVTDQEIQYIEWGTGMSQTLLRLIEDGDPVTLSATAKSDVAGCTTNDGSRPVTFASRNTSVVSVNNETKKLTIEGKGRTWLIASQAGGVDADGHDYLPVSDSLPVVVRNPEDVCECYLYNENDSVQWITNKENNVRKDDVSASCSIEERILFEGKSSKSRETNTTFAHAPECVILNSKNNNGNGSGTLYVEEYVSGEWSRVWSKTTFTTAWSAPDTIRGISSNATKIRAGISQSSNYLYFGGLKVVLAQYVEVVDGEDGAGDATETLEFTGKIGSETSRNVSVRWYAKRDLDLVLSEGAPFTLSTTGLNAECKIDTVPSLTITYNPQKAETDQEYTLLFTDKEEGGFRKIITLKASADAEKVYFQTNGYWADASNWKSSEKPNKYREACIDAGKEVTIATEVEAYALTIGSGSKVTILPTGGIKVGAGGISGASATSLILETDSTTAAKGQTGYLKISPEYTGAMPTAKVKMFSIAYANPSSQTATWQYVGIPVSSDTYGWDVCTTYGQQFIYGWNEATGGWFDAYEEKIDPFLGYCLTQNNDEDGKVFTFTGTLTKEDQTIDLSYTSSRADAVRGYHVLANSYTAPIDITQMESTDFVHSYATIFLFNTGSPTDVATNSGIATGGSSTTGQYIAVSPGTAAGIYEKDKTLPMVIPPMQGFCVQDTAEGAQLKLDYKKLVWDPSTYSNKPMRVAAQKSEEETDKLKIKDFIKMAISDGEAADILYLLASGSYDKSYENGYDAPKMMSDDPALPNIFAVEDDGQFAIDATSDIEGTFLGVRTGAATQYTMYFSHVDCETEWMLLDIERNEKTLITDGASYKFSAPAGQTINDRFLIVESDQSVGVTTGTDEIKTENKIQKFIYNDQMYILKDGVLYDARGMLIRR